MKNSASHKHRNIHNQNSKRSVRSYFANYFIRHLQVLLSSLGRICRTPAASFMTVAVIGIALALPSGLHILMKNFESVTSSWDGAAQISLFIKKGTATEKILSLQDSINLLAGIDSTEYIAPDDALEEFKSLSGFGQALDALDSNPLPAVIAVKPSINQSSPQQLDLLVNNFQKNTIVELAQLDMQWIKRLYSILDIITNGVWIIGALLAVSVLLVVGNTIRLDIQNRKDEILITKLVGATNAFIRRPFLYTGIWYGFLGGLIAFSLITGSLLILAAPISNLSSLYNSNFTVQGLGVFGFLTLIFSSTILGLLGSWIAVGRHLGKIEPS